MSDLASFWIEAVGSGVLSCVLLNNAVAIVQDSRRKRRERRRRQKQREASVRRRRSFFFFAPAVSRFERRTRRALTPHPSPSQNALAWLTFDPEDHDLRDSCAPPPANFIDVRQGGGPGDDGSAENVTVRLRVNLNLRKIAKVVSLLSLIHI